MKTSVVVLCIVGLCICCKPKPQQPDPPAKQIAVFTGRVVDVDGKALDGVRIDINGVNAEPSGNGGFRGTVDSTGRYVVNIQKRGYAMISKVFLGSVIDREYVMIRAARTVASPTQQIVANGNTGCNPSDLARVDWSGKKFESVPRVLDASGKLVDFGFTSTDMSQAFAALSTTPPCNPGGQVTIQANTLVDSGNQPPQGNVVVSFTTVDLYSEDGMPGDNSYINDSTRERGYMVSMGAVLVDIYSEDEKTDYNLKEKETATLRIPVDPLQVKLRKEIPETIPFLTYDAKDGYWKTTGTGKLNRKGMFYEAKVSHFSAYNMDIERATPSCVRFRQPANFNGNNTVEYRVASLTATGTIKYSITGTVKDFQGAGGNTCTTNNNNQSGNQWRGWQMLYNLPDNNFGKVMVAFYTLPPGGSTVGDPLAIYLIDTNPSYSSLPACDYAACATITAENFTDNILLASSPIVGNQAKLKWIANIDPSALPAGSTTITYEVVQLSTGCTIDQTNNGTSGCAATLVVPAINVPVSDDPRLPSSAKEATINTSGVDRIYVRATLLPVNFPGGFRNSKEVSYP